MFASFGQGSVFPCLIDMSDEAVSAIPMHFRSFGDCSAHFSGEDYSNNLLSQVTSTVTIRFSQVKTTVTIHFSQVKTTVTIHFSQVKPTVTIHFSQVKTTVTILFFLK